MKIDLKNTDAILKDIDETIKEIAIYLNSPKDKPIDTDYHKRIADLEVKMAKLWGLLITESPINKEEKLTKYGKKFSKLF